MFDIAWGEFVVIGVVALIVIGPKELPAVLRAVGHWTTKIRRMAAEFQSQFQEALREAEMADLKKEVDNLNNVARGATTDFDGIDNTRWQHKDEEYQRTVDSAAYPTDASSTPVTIAPQAVAPDGYSPSSDAAPNAAAGGSEAQTAGAPTNPSPPPADERPASASAASVISPDVAAPHPSPSTGRSSPVAGAAAHDP